jgi:septal ring factor EnvC (AmiA/AmiB activator)
MLLLRFGDKNAMGIKSDGWRIRTKPGALVVAPGDGRVEFADRFRRYNHIVIMNHNNGYISVLTGLETLNVLVGQEVLGGEPLGRMPPSGPELYMELHKDGAPTDPSRMFAEPR